MTRPVIRDLDAADGPWADALLGETLGGRMQARRGELIDALTSTGLVAELKAQAVGLAAWRLAPSGDEAELTVLAVVADARGRGVGRALVDAVSGALREGGVRRAWLVTTNDNLVALRLYQSAGWRLVALRPGAVDDARLALKPLIPPVAENGIPIRDELELEITLG